MFGTPTRMFAGVLYAALAVLVPAAAQVDTQQRHARPAYNPTDVCATQVLRRFNIPWSELEVWQDRYLNSGAVLVSWRTRQESGYCEVSARGELLRFVVEREADSDYYRIDTARACANEAARQRNIEVAEVRTRTINTNEQGRATVEWQTRFESGYCEVNSRGRVEYFKITQNSANDFSNAEQVCREAVMAKRDAAGQRVRVNSSGMAGQWVRVDWRTQREAGYCEVDRFNRLREFRVTTEAKPQHSGFRSQERQCVRFIAKRLNVARGAVSILTAYDTGNELIRVEWRAGWQEGYCTVRRGVVIGSSLR